MRFAVLVSIASSASMIIPFDSFSTLIGMGSSALTTWTTWSSAVWTTSHCQGLNFGDSTDHRRRCPGALRTWNRCQKVASPLASSMLQACPQNELICFSSCQQPLSCSNVSNSSFASSASWFLNRQISLNYTSSLSFSLSRKFLYAVLPSPLIWSRLSIHAQ